VWVIEKFWKQNSASKNTPETFFLMGQNLCSPVLPVSRRKTRTYSGSGYIAERKALTGGYVLYTSVDFIRCSDEGR
jgi:hypothetical protein